ncbi:nitrate- and nitrite sensing domain-containing protein [Streptomyces sp. MUM 136J]|uniref:nitrate- and nitrite sensing domain-containing protein n=1 Tax=Streptomyces sp. MUM 136J TaxID=2791992 RepID=UPI001F038EB4|nr:nitrate- and nitrite sensing domain-containing protein [Streptomyces sp. MUM 136J]MCH0571331.1 nitrate- and nitrite sensing domain-containing protein [Streptomyces sp. MUM 136J]
MRRSKNGPGPAARGNFTPPPRGAAPAPASGSEPAAAPAPSGGHLSPRNWRVPTRLNAILLIPVLVGLVMGGFQVKSSIDTWQEAEDAENVALLVRAADDYGNALLDERDLTASDLLQGKGTTETVKQLRAATDSAKDTFDQAAQNVPHTAALDRRMQLFRSNESKLEALRQAAYGKTMDPVKTEEGYVTVQHSLMEFANELGLGTGNVTSYGRTVYAVSLAKAAVSLQRSIGVHMLVRPSSKEAVTRQQSSSLVSYRYLEGIAVNEFVSAATQDDVDRLNKIMEAQRKKVGDTGTAVGAGDSSSTQGGAYTAMPAADAMLQGIAAGSFTADELAAKGVTEKSWLAASTAKFDGYREVETDLVNKAVSDAQDVADGAKRDALITGAAVVVALLAAFILAGMVARQMSRSMRQLRNAAFGIAEQRLPMLVDQLSRTDPGRVDTRVAPIPITTTDEIGEVARAFDQVHREAVRLAAEQALLRGNINAIFTNLSRRNQSLIEGQLTLITDLENNEADPDQLENLFRLDHLATRMRRNGENLLILAGEEPGRRWDQPVPLVDVLRAASSEVEQYERIELSGIPEAEIHGRAVTDLVHLLAELLENATTFSSPQTKVRVTATRLPDGRVMVEIHDKGIGLTAEDFADINHKLANPPTVDAAISQRMGLFVVGRLSDRHGIRVQLRPSGEQAGTTSLVMLPDAITHGGGGEATLERDEFTVSQMIPQQHFQGEDFNQPQPMRTAAELGFDDSRYAEVPDDIRDLDPVGRSLMREERRAALEAQTHPQPDQHASQAQAPSYADGFDPGQQNNYGEQEHASYDGQTAYEEQQHQADYGEPQQPAYDDPYFGQNGGLPQNDGFSSGGYPEPSYAEPTQEESASSHGAAAEGYPGLDRQSYQDDWPQNNGYRNGYPDEYAPEAESAQAADAGERDSVGFDRPGAAASAGHDLTDAGLPRRGSFAGGTNGASGHVQAETPGSVPDDGGDNGGWRSANDDRWQQASQLRKPKAGGVTASGLPRRVPKANLVEGSATSTPQGGPQVSRAPEDVRGRLSNLRRGVQRGRSAGSETNGQGFGPDSTYDQER